MLLEVSILFFAVTIIISYYMRFFTDIAYLATKNKSRYDIDFYSTLL